jgi:excisionase family DNA binding protein
MPKQPIGFRQRQADETSPVFARIPKAEAEKLDRAAFALKTSKQRILATLIAQHLEPLTVEAGEWATGRALVRAAAEVPDVLTPAQLAELLQVDEKTVRDLARRGQVPARKIGREWRFSRRAVLEWLGGA